MDITYSVPTPKTTHQTTRDARIKAHTLYYDANWSIDQICLQLNLTRRQVEYALQHRVTPQAYRRGRKVALNTPTRKRLVEWITTNKATREEDWYVLPLLLGLKCGIKAIRKALEIEGYVRRIARSKPPLTQEQRDIRLQWA